MGRGAQWISEAFALFRKAPLMWIGLLFLMLIIEAFISLVPVAGQLAANLIWPVFIAGLMAGCAAVDKGEPLTWGHLFKGFKEKTGPLIGLGATYVGLILGILILMFILSGLLGLGMLEMMAAHNPSEYVGSGSVNETIILLFVLVMLSLMLPITMAIWFAPALIMLGNSSVFAALKLSFIGCLKNILPYLIYSMALFILAIAAAIPLGLGFIVLIPVTCLTLYTAYKDIYTDQ